MAAENKTESKPESKPERIKVLALHGYLQNAEVFRRRTGSFSKGLKSLCEFVYLDAPFPVTAADGAEGRSWWQWSDESGNLVPPDQADHYTGLDVMVSHVMAALAEHQPDAVVGFSQGATAAALVLSRLQALAQLAQPEEHGHLAYPGGGVLKFAILVGAFLPRDEEAAAAMSRAKPRLNTLFITGEQDQIVPPDRTEKLMECFGGPTTCTKLVHPGGHCVPTATGELKNHLREFITAAAIT